MPPGGTSFYPFILYPFYSALSRTMQSPSYKRYRPISKRQKFTAAHLMFVVINKHVERTGNGAGGTLWWTATRCSLSLLLTPSASRRVPSLPRDVTCFHRRDDTVWSRRHASTHRQLIDCANASSVQVRVKVFRLLPLTPPLVCFGVRKASARPASSVAHFSLLYSSALHSLKLMQMDS